MKPSFNEDTSMDEIMRAWPNTIRVVLEYRMLCIGCPIASFHTISDACREHGIDRDLFLRDIYRAIGSEEVHG